MEAFNPTIAGISGSILQILSQRWHPIQDLLTQLGIKMKELWVDIVEEIAKAVDFAFKLGEGIADALSQGSCKWRRADCILSAKSVHCPTLNVLPPAKLSDRAFRLLRKNAMCPWPHSLS